MAASGGVRPFQAVLFDWRGTLAVDDGGQCRFARDVGVTLRRLRAGGVRIGIRGDDHAVIVAALTGQHSPDRTTWADLVDFWMRPGDVDLGFPAERVLLVASRAEVSLDPGFARMPCLLLPPLGDPGDLRLRHVLSLAAV